MKQSSLLSFVSQGGLSPNTRVVDLFCGIGGFSCGAKLAGHEVVLAVDSNPFLLGCHVRNNPYCKHICAELPKEDLPLPSSGEWHLHASPPCTHLSIMQPMQRPGVRAKAKDMVHWFLDFAVASSATTWSMEQVPHEAVREKLKALKRKHPMKVDWIVIDAVDYEVPQHRKRVVAGSPCIIANLRSFRSKKRKLTVRDAMPDAPRPFLRNSLYSRPHHVTRETIPVPLKDKLRSIDKPSFTMLSNGHAKWASADGTVLRHLKGDEKALIQTFPPSYKLPWSNTEALLGVGNAVPPRLAEILMQPTLKHQ